MFKFAILVCTKAIKKRGEIPKESTNVLKGKVQFILLIPVFGVTFFINSNWH